MPAQGGVGQDLLLQVVELGVVVGSDGTPTGKWGKRRGCQMQASLG